MVEDRMKVALYARVSTRDKNQDPETQLLVLREWTVRQGYEAVEFVDYASGGNLNRPGWLAMMAEVRKGRFDVVAVVRLDRAFRSVADLHSTLAELEGRGVRFAAVTQPIDTGTAVGRLLITVVGAVAEFERDITRERVMEGLARARREGHRPGPERIKLSAERARTAIHEHGSVRKAARVLGVSPATVQRRASHDPTAAAEASDGNLTAAV